MNWIITTRIPYPTARTAMPRHDVVFPFPLPVRTRTSPRRGFSGILPSRFLAMAPSSRLRCIASRFPCTMIALSGKSRHAGQGGPMGDEPKRCMVCAKEKAFEGSIFDDCKALIRGEASEKGKKIKQEAEREIRREGIPPKK